MDTIKIFGIYVPKNYIKKYVKEEIKRIPLFLLECWK